VLKICSAGPELPPERCIVPIGRSGRAGVVTQVGSDREQHVRIAGRHLEVLQDVAQPVPGEALDLHGAGERHVRGTAAERALRKSDVVPVQEVGSSVDGSDAGVLRPVPVHVVHLGGDVERVAAVVRDVQGDDKVLVRLEFPAVLVQAQGLPRGDEEWEPSQHRVHSTATPADATADPTLVRGAARRIVALVHHRTFDVKSPCQHSPKHRWKRTTPTPSSSCSCCCCCSSDLGIFWLLVRRENMAWRDHHGYIGCKGSVKFWKVREVRFEIDLRSPSPTEQSALGSRLRDGGYSPNSLGVAHVLLRHSPYVADSPRAAPPSHVEARYTGLSCALLFACCLEGATTAMTQ
jgi:hypothetical protein